MLDQLDRKILLELQKNARMSNAELAEKVNLSPTPCLRRVKKLEHSGVIKSYRAELDLNQLGITTSALVFVQLTLNSTENAQEFESAVKNISAVQTCFVLTGLHDYSLRVVARDLSDYERIIKGELANIPNIKTIESTIIMNQIIDHQVLPIGDAKS